MKLIPMIVIAALTFGVCYLVDKGFHRTFRGKAQHISGRSVRLNKRYATIGIVLFFLGICAVFAGLRGYLALTLGGAVVALMGVALIVYYMTFGIFYDEDGFVLTTFGKRSTTYHCRCTAGTNSSYCQSCNCNSSNRDF